MREFERRLPRARLALRRSRSLLVRLTAGRQDRCLLAGAGIVRGPGACRTAPPFPRNSRRCRRDRSRARSGLAQLGDQIGEAADIDLAKPG